MVRAGRLALPRLFGFEPIRSAIPGEPHAEVTDERGHAPLTSCEDPLPVAVRKHLVRLIVQSGARGATCTRKACGFKPPRCAIRAKATRAIDND